MITMVKRTRKITLTPKQKGNASQEKIADIMKSLEDAKRYSGSNSKKNTDNEKK